MSDFETSIRNQVRNQIHKSLSEQSAIHTEKEIDGLVDWKMAELAKLLADMLSPSSSTGGE